MVDTRYFGVIRFASDSGFAVFRDDDQGQAFVPEREVKAAGGLSIGDRVIFSLRPGGMAHDVVLDRHARHLAAQEAAR